MATVLDHAGLFTTVRCQCSTLQIPHPAGRINIPTCALGGLWIGDQVMLKREDSFTPGQLRPGDHVLLADDDAEEFPLSYEGDIIAANGSALQVRLTEVRPISIDHQLPESYPRPGEEISVLVSDVSSRRGDQTD